MARVRTHRTAIIETAARLFRQQGYAATGLNQIVTESGAPKGSMYHYFPDGKEAIAAATVAYAGERVASTLLGLASESSGPGDLVRRYGGLLGQWMAQSAFRDGCPIATTLLETTPQTDSVRIAGAAALNAWSNVFSDSLCSHRVPASKSRRLATMAIAALEGALIQARVSVNEKPILDTAAEVAQAFDAAVSAVSESNSQ